MYGISLSSDGAVYHNDGFWCTSIDANCVFITDDKSKAKTQLKKLNENCFWYNLHLRIFEFSEEMLEEILFLKLRGGNDAIIDRYYSEHQT